MTTQNRSFFSFSATQLRSLFAHLRKLAHQTSQTVLCATSFSCAAILLPFGKYMTGAPTQPAAMQNTLQNELQTPPNEFCSITNEAFQAGEKLTYKVYYNLNFVWVPAGEVVFSVTEQNNMLRLSATGRTYKSYEWFFKVRDLYEVYVDKTTMQPVMSVREIHEGSFNLFHRQTFDFNKKQVTVESGDNRSQTEKEKFNFQGCVHDIVSMIYYARNLDPNAYKKDQKIPIKVFMDKQTYNVNVHFKGKEAQHDFKEVGKYKTYKFSPEMVTGGVFKESASMTVYCSDDKNRIPLMIESSLAVGSVKVMLNKTEGIKNPMTAKLN
jgi:Protein of unknown function (DUF3108)